MYLSIFLFFILINKSYCNDEDKPSIDLFKSSKLIEGKKFSLTCQISSEKSRTTTFEWLFNGQKVKLSNNIAINQVDESSILTIKAMNSEYNGEFTCLIKSAFGQVSKSIQLILNGIVRFIILIKFNSK